MNESLLQHGLDPLARAFEQRPALFVIEPHFMERRRRRLFIADVLHQDGVLADSIWFRHRHTGVVEGLQGREFIHKPRGVANLYAECRFLVDGPDRSIVAGSDGLWPPVLFSQQLAALPVHGVVTQVSELAGPIDFGRDPFHFHGWVGAAAIDVGLLSPFHLRHHIYDLILLVKRLQGVSEENPFEAGRRIGDFPDIFQSRDF